MLLEKRWQPALLALLGTLVLLSWVAANLLAAMAGILAKGHLSTNHTSLLMIVIVVVGFQGVALGWVHWFLKLHEVTWTSAFGLSRGNHLQCLRIALVALPVVLLFVFLLSKCSQWVLEYLHGLLLWSWLKPHAQLPVELLQNTWSLHLLAVQAVLTIIIAPVAEEVLFRGILYTAIKQRRNRHLALWATSFAFALIHVYPVGFLSLIFLAAVLAVLYEQTKNLLAPILLHSLFNAVNFVLIVVHPKWVEKLFTT